MTDSIIMTATEEQKNEELKRLGFVYEYGALGLDTANKFYELAKKQAPTTLTPGKSKRTDQQIETKERATFHPRVTNYAKRVFLFFA